MEKIIRSVDCFSKYSLISILVRKIRFLSKFSKNLHFRENLKSSKSSILVKIFENLDFGQNFLKISILVKIPENPDFGQQFRKMSNFVKIYENVDSDQNLRKISTLV